MSPDSPRFRPSTLACALLLGLACDPKSGEQTAAKGAPTPTEKRAQTKDPPKTAPAPAASDKDAAEVAPKTEPPAEPKAQVAAGTDAPPTPPSPASLSDALAAIPADASDANDRAVEAFLAHHTGAKHGEAAMQRDLEALLAFIDARTPKLTELMWKDAELSAAACRFTKECDSGEPTKAGEERLAKIRASGITVVYAGEGTVEAAVDYAPLGARLASVLTPGARAYLDAMTAEQQAMSLHDEGGYTGEPRALADAALGWEKVAASGGEAYAAVAGEHARSMMSAYLRVPFRPFLDRGHVVTKELRKEYARFVADHGTSGWTPAVTHYLTAMKALKHRPTEEQLDAAITAALDHAATKP